MSTLEDRAVLDRGIADGLKRYSYNNKQRIAVALMIGGLLKKRRAVTEHGEWMPYLDEMGIGHETARRWMALADADMQIPHVVEFGGIRSAFESLKDKPEPDAPEPIATREEMEEALDELEAENHELRQERAPTQADQLRSELDGAQLDLAEVSSERDELKERVRWLENEQSDAPHEREQVFNNYRAEINALRASRDDWIGKYNDLNRRYKGVVKKLRELGAE